MAIPIQHGDIAARAGVVGASGYNYTFLTKIIKESYNHAGLAISPSEIHHVESNGYENVNVNTFFSPANATTGAVIRFVGPAAARIRIKVSAIAKDRSYKKIPGNPFSTAKNLTTVNCNEFVHELFRKAIADLLKETRTTDTATFATLTKAYTNSAGNVKDLITARKIEFTLGSLATGPAVAALEAGAKTQANHPDVKIKYEGKIEMRNLYPESWGKSWNPFKSSAYQDGFYSVAVLDSYTPNSFISSPLFSLVHRVTIKSK